MDLTSLFGALGFPSTPGQTVPPAATALGGAPAAAPAVTPAAAVPGNPTSGAQPNWGQLIKMGQGMVNQPVPQMQMQPIQYPRPVGMLNGG
jgi:hypothetical protein